MRTRTVNFIKITEKALLAVIALLTVVATFEEVVKIYDARSVQLADLLLLFIYTEVLGMIGIFCGSTGIPITLPIFIAMTYRSFDHFARQRDGYVISSFI